MTQINTKATIKLNFDSIINILIKSVRTFSLVLTSMSIALAFGGIYLKHLIISPIRTLSMTTLFIGVFMGILVYNIFSSSNSEESQSQTQNENETENEAEQSTCICPESCPCPSNEPVSNEPVSNEPVSNEPVSNKPQSTTEELLITLEKQEESTPDLEEE